MAKHLLSQSNIIQLHTLIMIVKLYCYHVQSPQLQYTIMIKLTKLQYIIQQYSTSIQYGKHSMIYHGQGQHGNNTESHIHVHPSIFFHNAMYLQHFK